jgi:actin-like ATPase involved in cell morphogenesis
MLTLGGRSVVIPSAAYLDEDGTLLCGEAAVHRSVTDPDRVARGFKRRLGDPTPVRMGVGSRLAAELLAAQLGEVLRVAAETEGAAPDRVMLTHPANWGPFRRDVFAEVAKLAGLEGAPTVTEPEAAAIHYARSRELADGRLVAVYDLGGGTFDATVLRADPAQVELLGVPEGIERLGGLDFDEALFAHLDHACDGVLSALDSHDPQAAVTLARLEQDLVLAKEHLSVDAHATVPVFLPDRNFEVRITRGVFEDLIRAHIESTVGALERTLRSAHLTASDLDAILLVGGSSRIPLVAEMITEALCRPVVVDTHPKYVVALGAAALAAQLDAAQIDTAHSNTAQIDTAPVETAPQAVATHAEVASRPTGATKSRRRAWMASAGHDRVFAGARHLSHADDQRGAKLPAGLPAALLVGGSRDDAGVADPTLWGSPSDADWFGGQSSPGSTGTGHAPAEGADGADDPRPASRAGTRVVVAALALVGISTAGFLSRGSVSPVAEGLTAATPPATCQSGCAVDPLRDAPAKASAPSSRCPGLSDMPSGCESGLPRVPPPSGTANRVPVKALPSRPRPALPIPPADLAPQNMSPVAVGEKNDEYKETGEKTSAEKTSAEKTSAEKKSEKKSKEKAKEASRGSSALDLFSD